MAVITKLQKLVDLYHEEKMSHVYLLETNNLDKAYTDLLQVIKQINCEKEFVNDCHKCNLCNLVNQASLPSLVVVEADGNNIKKEQVVELKRKFSYRPVYTTNNIYIIKNAAKMNKESSNTMLKFIEEPNDNILGFLLTENLNNVLPTIRSRCEILKIWYEEDNNIDKDDYQNKAIEYIKKTELEKNGKIMYNKSVILSDYSERQDIELIFKEILQIYLNQYEQVKGYDFLNHLNADSLRKRINLVANVLNNINTNANIELLLDKYIIELSDENA